MYLQFQFFSRRGPPQFLTPRTHIIRINCMHFKRGITGITSCSLRHTEVSIQRLSATTLMSMWIDFYSKSKEPLKDKLGKRFHHSSYSVWLVIGDTIAHASLCHIPNGMQMCLNTLKLKPGIYSLLHESCICNQTLI